MKKVFVVLAALAMLCLGGMAQANVFNLGTGYTNLETVTVGDAGNAADTRIMYDGTTGYGSVGYDYRIGKYEVTAAQYCDFLNHKAKSDPYGLYNTDMGSTDSVGCNIKREGNLGEYTYTVAPDWANRPVNYVSFWDSCRFVNWLNNGQGDGDTETGAYTLSGYLGDDGRTIERNPEAKWYLPSEDEWYKAAYYKGQGTNAGYWDYSTQSNIGPSHDVLSVDPGNGVNYAVDSFSIGSPYYRTNVGEFENSPSAYGTFDQSGNVWEWNDTVVAVYYFTNESARGLRGGSFFSNVAIICASQGNGTVPSELVCDLGFRVASAVPEPSSILAILGGLTSFLAFRRRKA